MMIYSRLKRPVCLDPETRDEGKVVGYFLKNIMAGTLMKGTFEIVVIYLLSCLL